MGKFPLTRAPTRRNRTARQARPAVGAFVGGKGCRVTCSRDGFKHAQLGALAVQMFVVGSMDEGSSRFPARTTRNWGRADDMANRCEPQIGQNCRMISFPLSATFLCSASAPETIRPSASTSRFTVPFAARCWQSRHQQMRLASGSVTSLKLTAPQRHRPVLSIIDSILFE